MGQVLPGIGAAAGLLASGDYGSPNWANISAAAASADNSGSAHTAGATKSIKALDSGASGTGTLTITPVVDGVDQGSLTVGGGVGSTFTHSAGLSCYFRADLTGSPGDGRSGTITVTNETDGGAVLDTFTVSLNI